MRQAVSQSPAETINGIITGREKHDDPYIEHLRKVLHAIEKKQYVPDIMANVDGREPALKTRWVSAADIIVSSRAIDPTYVPACIHYLQELGMIKQDPSGLNRFKTSVAYDAAKTATASASSDLLEAK